MLTSLACQWARARSKRPSAPGERAPTGRTQATHGSGRHHEGCPSDIVGTVGAAEENLVLSLIGVGYAVADCTPLERDAREAAFNDARARAELQAELMGVSLGEAVAASDVPLNFSETLGAYYGVVTPTQVPCSPPAPAPTSGSPVSVPPFDPTDGAEVNVYAQIAVTFEIATDAEATPAT